MRLGRSWETKESFKDDIKNPGDRDWLLMTVSVVIEHLNKFGACINDDFLEEVQSLQSATVRYIHYRYLLSTSTRSGTQRIDYDIDLATTLMMSDHSECWRCSQDILHLLAGRGGYN